MDLLSFVGMATRRKQEYIRQAKTLAKKYKKQEVLEKQMENTSLALVKGYRDKMMKWAEYERSLLDKTIISALAAVYLGTENDKPDQKLEEAWPIIVGNMLPPLSKFLAETKEYIDSGVLKPGDDTQDFADYDLDQVVPVKLNSDGTPVFETSPEEQAEIEASQRRAQGKSWPALLTRVIQYLARPVFSYFNLGRYMVAKDQGYKEMRRIATKDKKTCKDCLDYSSKGWQPMGSLPMPGQDCRCYARCRCSIEYR